MGKKRYLTNTDNANEWGTRLETFVQQYSCQSKTFIHVFLFTKQKFGHFFLILLWMNTAFFNIVLKNPLKWDYHEQNIHWTKVFQGQKSLQNCFLGVMFPWTTDSLNNYQLDNCYEGQLFLSKPAPWINVSPSFHTNNFTVPCFYFPRVRKFPCFF